MHCTLKKWSVGHLKACILGGVAVVLIHIKGALPLVRLGQNYQNFTNTVTKDSGVPKNQ